jgi:hypothetical protein
MLFVRRYLAMAALFFWQGGFVFYASVVVPVGQDVVGRFEQASITQVVTRWLNFSGTAAVVLLLWECVAARDPARWRYWGRVTLWLVMMSTLGLLYWLHSLLERSLAGTVYPLDFHTLHRLYLWAHTIQWLAAVVYLGLAILAWRAEDRERSDATVLMAPNTRANGAA